MGNGCKELEPSAGLMPANCQAQDQRKHFLFPLFLSAIGRLGSCRPDCCALPDANTAIYNFSTCSLAQGVFRRNFKLDFTVGSFLKQLILIFSASPSQPWCSTSFTTICSRLRSCKGLFGCLPIMAELHPCSGEYGASASTCNIPKVCAVEVKT